MKHIEKSVPLILILAISCQSNIIQINTNNDSYYEKTAINLDDYIKGEIKMIPLETNDSCLVSESDKVYPTENFIYIYSIDRILQFDYKGDFIKSISRRGSGPGEVTYIADCAVDSNDENLYCVQQDEKDSIMVFDISTGNYARRIPNWSRNALVAISMLSDTTIICFQRENPTDHSNILAHIQNVNGDLISELNHEITTVDGLVMRKRPYILHYNDDIIYLPNRSDTIYKLRNYNSVEPFILIRRPEGEEVNRYNSVFMFNGASILVSSTDYEMKYVGDGNVIMEPTKIGYYFVDMNNKKIARVEKVFSEKANISFSKSNLSEFFNNVSFIKKDYMSLMISSSSKDVTNTDNPTLLIAKF